MPFWTVEIRTPLPAETVRDRLRQKVQTNERRGFWERMEASLDPAPAEPPFKGTVSENEFDVVRVIRYRNSFLPVIHGTFSAAVDGGTVIRVRMRLHLFTATFMLFWLGAIAAAVWRSLGTVNTLDERVLMPVAMLLFGLLMPIVSFYPEARKAERIIRDAVTPLETH